MSATLRYDIGQRCADAITYTDQQSNFLDKFGGKVAERWSGLRKSPNYNLVYTFAIKLPTQCGEALRFLEHLLRIDKIDHIVATRTVKNGCRTLARKLIASLGLPLLFGSTETSTGNMHGVCSEENQLLKTIFLMPHDSVSWHVYTDWLEESNAEAALRRVQIIRGWLGKKAVKVKYGIPVLARSDYREES